MNHRVLVAAGAATLASVAVADVAVSTFTFSDLNSEYFTADGETGIYTSRAAEFTSGDVTRLMPAGAQTAEFGPAFATDDSIDADVVFEMSISNITAVSADGEGTFSITDIDGDMISGDLEGTWTRAIAGAPILFFNGTLSNVAFTSGEEMV